MSTTTTPAEQPRMLGDLTTRELVESAMREVNGFAELVRSVTNLSDTDRLVAGAYVGSILARLAVAKDRL